MPDLNAKVERLGLGVGRLADDVEALSETVTVEKNWRRRFTLAVGIGAAVVLALVCVLIYLAVGNRSLLSKFNECTTAGSKAHPHKCYDDGQKASGKAIAAIQSSNAKAAAFAVECVIGGRADVEQCVEGRFKGEPAPPAVAAATAANADGAPTATTTATATTPPPLLSSSAAPAPTLTNTGTTTTTRPPAGVAPAPPVATPPDATSPTTVVTAPPPPVNACQLDLKVFCLGLTPTNPNCPSVAGMCLPTVTPKGT